MTVLLQTAGWILIFLALLHLDFPRRFAWKRELARLSLLNKQVMEVHTFFIALTLILMGALCISSAELLHTSTLGKRVSWGLFVFWLARLAVQFVWYSPSLWRGKRFETVVHLVFVMLWVFFSGLFLMSAAGWDLK